MIGHKVFPFFLLLLTGVCSAQTTVEISGRVTDSTAHALPMTNVRLVAGSDTLIRYTDDAGVFSFRIAPAKQIQIIATHVGFGTDSKTL